MKLDALPPWPTDMSGDLGLANRWYHDQYRGELIKALRARLALAVKFMEEQSLQASIDHKDFTASEFNAVIEACREPS